MTMNAKNTTSHTPTPWHVTTDNGGRATEVWAKSLEFPKLRLGLRVADTCTPEDAALIVRAVNSHAALVEALEDAEFIMRKIAANPSGALGFADTLKRATHDAQSALKLAKEGQQ